MKTTLKGLILGLFVAIPAMAQTPKVDYTQLFVKVNSGKKLPNSKFISKAKNLFGDVYLVSTSNLKELEKDLKKSSSIKYTERNYYAGDRTLPEIDNTKSFGAFYFNNSFNDPEVRKIWSFQDAEKSGVSVNKSYLAPLNTGKTEVIVAVVDTGVDYNHEDLKDVMWKNTNEIPNNGIDDDMNGYVDDVYGINTIDRDENGNASGDPMAGHAHGTHVSGTIAAKQNNNIGIAGIASTVKIMAIKTVPDASDETDVDVVESFLYAAKHGAKLINCSFGKTHNEGGMIVQETIDHIGQAYGTLVVAAAGNDYGKDIDTDLVYPASFESDYLMVVASTMENGALSWFSNIGFKNVDVAAPGSNIYSTVPNNSYANMSGTSMATPTTVGVAAEVLSHFPNLSPLELKQTLMDSVTKVEDFSEKMVTGGRVDLYNALMLALSNETNP